MNTGHFRHRLAFLRHMIITGGLTPTLLPAEESANRALGLVKEGIGIGFEFGPNSLERLVSIAELSEQSVYERHSLRRISDGVEFVLLNPPLRMGAYYTVRLSWDGAIVEPTEWTIAIGEAPPRAGATIDKAHPITLPVGTRSTVRARLAEVARGTHRVGLEFLNIAIPPKVWMEFHERVGE